MCNLGLLEIASFPVVESECNVEIQKNVAESKVKEAEGSKAAAILQATGETEAIKLRANAQAEATKATAQIGNAEAEVILSKGKSTAEAYRLEVQAMGQDVFGQIQMGEKIASGTLKLIPDNLVIGGGGGGAGGLMNGFFGISLIEKLTGRSFTVKDAEKPAELPPVKKV